MVSCRERFKEGGGAVADVFISYHEKSAGELARQIATALEINGISCWYARRDIPPGGDFARYIPPQIEVCKVFLLILNENAQKSRHIESELGLAFSNLNRGGKITILPIQIEDFDMDSWLKYYLIHAQTIKMPALDAERLRELAQQVAKLLNRELTPQEVEPQPPTPSAKIIKRGKCGKGAKRSEVTYILDENGVLKISGTGRMRDFKSLNVTRDTLWRNKREMVSCVEIQNGVTYIGESAFDGCMKLGSVAVPNSVTSIGSWVFHDCQSLTSIVIPNSVISIGESAFSGCTGLTSSVIPGSVVSIGESAFSGCAELTSVIICDGVTCIEDWAFFKCERLTSVAIPDSVTSIGNYAFRRCANLTSVVIPDSVTSIGENAFHGCANLISIHIPENLTSIEGWAFKDCKSLTNIDIPNSVASIGRLAFSGCAEMTSVTIPDSVTEIGWRAFHGCKKLKSVSVPAKAEVDDKAFPRTVRVTRRW